MEINIPKEAANYSIAVVGYEARYGLPMNFFSNPDHLALKASSTHEFEQLVRTVTNVSEEVYCIDAEPRFLVAAKLAGTLSVGLHGNVRWLEIKEPIDGYAKDDEYTGLEHVEFYLPNFGAAVRLLDQKGLDPLVLTEGDKFRVNIPLTDEGQELRLTNTHIESIVGEKLEDGSAFVLKAAA